MKNNSTSSLVESILNNKLSQTDKTKLLRICYSVSYSTWSSLSTEIFNKNSALLDDLAINSIVPLFSKNGNNRLKIESYLFAKKDDLKEESDIQFFLHKLVWERVEGDVCWKMVLKDKIFKKLYHNLISMLKTNTLKRVYYFNNSYIVSSNVDQIYGNVISFNRFKELPNCLFSDELNVIIEGILKYLKEETKFFPAVPFVPLILRI